MNHIIWRKFSETHNITKIGEKDKKQQQQINMIVSQRTFMILLLFSVSNIRCETDFKSGEHTLFQLISSSF